MPPNFKGNVSPSMQSANSPEMEAAGSNLSRSTLDTQASRTATPSLRKKEKQSLDYALRSGLAGGLAGCAVSSHHWIYPPLCNADYLLLV